MSSQSRNRYESRRQKPIGDADILSASSAWCDVDLFEVFDNEQVQLVTRRQAAATFLTLAGAIGGSLILFVLIGEGVVSYPGAVALGSLLWIVAGVRLIRHIRRTNHVVWCVKISPAQIAGYDYARRQTSLYWTDVRQIEIASEGLRVRGTIDRHIEIPTLFQDYAGVSHRIVEHAERHHIPILVDGRPLDDLDLYVLYPFLAPGVSAR